MNNDRTKEIIQHGGRLEYWAGDCFTKIDPEAATQKRVFTIAAIFFFFIKRNLGVCLGLFLLRFLFFSLY